MQKKTLFLLLGIEAAVILILAVLLGVFIYLGAPAYSPHHSETPLLSPRIYSGLLPAHSNLIFNLKPLERDIRTYLDNRHLNASLTVVNLRDGASFGIRQNQEFDPASLNKLPIAIIILRQVERGEITLDTQLPITPHDLNADSGSLYDDHRTSLSVRDLLKYMLAESDNTATFTLLDRVSFDEFEEISSYLNYYNPALTEEIPSPTNNVFSASTKSTYNLFMSLYLSTLLIPEHSEFILSELTNTSFDIHEQSEIPRSVTIAQKYGAYYDDGKELFHSCGIMYLDDTRFFYCLMSKDIARPETEDVTGYVVRSIYDYILKTRDELENADF